MATITHTRQNHEDGEDTTERKILFRNTSSSPFRLRWRESPNPIGTISPQDSLGQLSHTGHVFELTQTAGSSSGSKRFLIQVGERNQEQTATITSSYSISCDGGCSCVWEGSVEEQGEEQGDMGEDVPNREMEGVGMGARQELGNLLNHEHSSAILFLLLGIVIYVLRNYFGVKILA